jgi:hypothetical protein
MELRGFPIPPLLEKFLNEGIWTHKRSIIIPTEMLSHTGMDWIVKVRLYELDELLFDNSDNAWYYDWSDENFKLLERMSALVSSKRSGEVITDRKKLDVDKAIVIASELSDDIICLDYRFDVNNPPVVIMDWARTEWAVLAPNFDAFAKGIGLLE